MLPHEIKESKKKVVFGHPESQPIAKAKSQSYLYSSFSNKFFLANLEMGSMTLHPSVQRSHSHSEFLFLSTCAAYLLCLNDSVFIFLSRSACLRFRAFLLFFLGGRMGPGEWKIA